MGVFKEKISLLDYSQTDFCVSNIKECWLIEAQSHL
jgi:hypothetical protein